MSDKREILIETALRLFNEGGFRSTGVDRILAEAGVAKMTLYKYFPSKDDLILEALRRRDLRWRQWMRDELVRASRDPRERIIALFDVAERWFSMPEFNGCPFIRAASEFGELTDPVHVACAEHSRLFKQDLSELAEAAGAQDPAALVDQLSLLLSGAIVEAQLSGDAAPARTARSIAEAIVDSMIPADLDLDADLVDAD